MWDISEYLPFEAFVVIGVFVLGYIACRGENRQERSDRIKRGYKSAMKKYPKIIANLAQRGENKE